MNLYKIRSRFIPSGTTSHPSKNCIDLAELITIFVFKYEEDQYLHMSILMQNQHLYVQSR